MNISADVILCVYIESMSMDRTVMDIDMTEDSNKHINEATGMSFYTVYVIRSARRYGNVSNKCLNI